MNEIEPVSAAPEPPDLPLIGVQLDLWRALNLFLVLDSLLNDECEDDPAANSIQLFRDQSAVALEVLRRGVGKLDALPFAVISQQISVKDGSENDG